MIVKNYLTIVCLTAECDFSAVDIEGQTALHWTVANPDPTAFYALLQAHPPLLNRQLVKWIIKLATVLYPLQKYLWFYYPTLGS